MPNNSVKSGYVNGSDLLCSFGGKAIGHCTSHSATFNTETSEVAVKPVASQALSANSLYKEKRVTGLGVQIRAEGVQFYGETEGGFKSILAPWSKGQSVKVNLFERESDQTPYFSGDCIITSIEQMAPAGQDATYNITFENNGAPDVLDESKITGETVSGE